MPEPANDTAGAGPVVLTALTAYRDERGNEVVASSAHCDQVRITFRGGNNRVVVADGARLRQLLVVFDCSDGQLDIGPSRGVPKFATTIRIGQDGVVCIGRNVSSTEIVVLSATEGTTITIGNDVMFSSNNEVLCDDGHPIFHVRDGRRANVSRSITIGNHVWLAKRASVLGGGSIGDGSVLGYGAVLTRLVPNNCVAAGVPAKVVRRDIAWERPHLSLKQPYYKPDASTVKKSKYWKLTSDEQDRRVRLRQRFARGPLGPVVRRVAAALRRRG